MTRATRTLAACLLLSLWAGTEGVGQNVPVSENLWRLEAQEDTDGDRRITVRDKVTPFEVRGPFGIAETVTDMHQLSILLQELKRAQDQHHHEDFDQRGTFPVVPSTLHRHP